MKKEELEKIAAEMKAREKLGTNISDVIYDAEPDIKTLIRTKSSGGETLGRFASFMDRPLLQAKDSRIIANRWKFRSIRILI